MSNNFDDQNLSDIIQLATQEIISNTKDFIQTVDEKIGQTDTISLMLNGVETILSIEDYNLLKAQNEEIKQRMKSQIKEITDELKSNSKK